MRRIAALGLLALLGGACFEDSNPVDETGAMQSSGEECIAGTEGCPCIEGGCVGELVCLSNVCVDAGSTSAATGETTTASTTSSATTTPETSTSTTTPTTLEDGPAMTSDVAGGLPPGAQCDPFFDLCDIGLGCVGLDENGFVCDVPGPGQQDEPCENEGCGVGLLCMQAEVLAMCQSMVGCCSALCDLNGGSDQCPTGLVCQEFYPPMQAPPGYEHVGVCIVG
jgi:hypothetical protein